MSSVRLESFPDILHGLKGTRGDWKMGGNQENTQVSGRVTFNVESFTENEKCGLPNQQTKNAEAIKPSATTTAPKVSPEGT